MKYKMYVPSVGEKKLTQYFSRELKLASSSFLNDLLNSNCPVAAESEEDKPPTNVTKVYQCYSHVLEWIMRMKNRPVYQLKQLISLNGEQFAQAAYQAILQRQADPDGLDGFINALCHGEHTKIELLILLKNSEEARQHRVKVKGLQKYRRLHRFVAVPLIGKTLKRLFELFSMIDTFATTINMAEQYYAHQLQFTQELAQLNQDYQHLQKHCQNLEKDIEHFHKKNDSNEVMQKSLISAEQLGFRYSQKKLERKLVQLELMFNERYKQTDQRYKNTQRAQLHTENIINQLEADHKNDQRLTEDKIDSKIQQTNKIIQRNIDSVQSGMCDSQKKSEKKLSQLESILNDSYKQTYQRYQKSQNFQLCTEKNIKQLEEDQKNDQKRTEDKIDSKIQQTNKIIQRNIDSVQSGMCDSQKKSEKKLSQLESMLNDSYKQIDKRYQKIQRVQLLTEKNIKQLEEDHKNYQRLTDGKIDRKIQQTNKIIQSNIDSAQSVFHDGQKKSDNKLADLAFKYHVIEQQYHQGLEKIKKFENNQEKYQAQLTHEIERSSQLLSMDNAFIEKFQVNHSDVFRGPFEEVKQKLKVYLPYLQQNEMICQQYPVLEIGCGRGEWLEIMLEQNYPAKGVEINRLLVESSVKAGLDVVYSDGLQYMQTLEDDSVSVVSSFHVVEHLPINQLLEFVRQSYRIVKPGGLVILETPNPENIIVGSCNFYLDFTHLKPLPPKLLEFLLKEFGFSIMEVMRLHPKGEMQIEDKQIKLLSDYLYSAQDYAIIGEKK